MHYVSRSVLLALCVAATACGKNDNPPAAGGNAAAPSGTTATQAAAPAPTAPPVAAPAIAADATTTASADDKIGQGVFNKTCALCHAAGVAGAPMPGNKDEWASRIAQGVDVLYKHAMEGYTGSKGMMPPRGGNTALSDDEIKAAVDYMVKKSS